MTKYIIELDDDIKYLIINGRTDNRCYTLVRPVEELEILNSDYINEHYGQMQDEAYRKGYADGREVGIKDGMCDAWEAAKKIALMDTKTSENVTGYFGLFRIMENLTPMQAIEKLKAYEDKQKDRIEVGDFVRSNEFRDIVVCVTYVDAEWKNFSGFAITDTQACRKGHAFASCRMDRWHKTGEHFDIEPLWKGES